MKNRKILIACALILVMLHAFGQKATVVYTEGTSRIKSASGALREADFGSTVTYGESVITGKDGNTELKLQDGSTIRVTSNSVFNYSSTGSGSDSRPVLATSAGKIAYKISKVTGRSPVIQTNSMVAGVRGTEFTVYAGRDGSVLISVEEGIVDVASQGESVELLANEAVEVAPGEKPGAKYVWLGKELDFSDWNAGKNAEFLADPLAGLEKAASQLKDYKDSLFALKAPYEAATERWRKATEDYKTVLAEGNEEKTKQFQRESLFPAQDERATLILDIRYYALNYLSVRRYVLSNMYMEMKSRYPLKQGEREKAFFARHAELLALYEMDIVPELNENDY